MVAYKLRWSAVEGLFWVPTLKELWTDDDRYPSSGRGADQTHTKTDKMLYLYCKCCFKWVKVDLHVITGLIHDQYWKIVAQEVFNGWCPDKCWCYAFWIQSLCIPDLSCNLKSELLFIDEAEILSLVSQCSGSYEPVNDYWSRVSGGAGPPPSFELPCHYSKFEELILDLPCKQFIGPLP